MDPWQLPMLPCVRAGTGFHLPSMTFEKYRNQYIYRKESTVKKTNVILAIYLTEICQKKT